MKGKLKKLAQRVLEVDAEILRASLSDVLRMTGITCRIGVRV